MRRTSQRSVATEIFRKRNISFPLHPFQKLLHNRYLNRVVSSHTDGRREGKPRFCCREKSGATETLISQMVE